MRNKTILRQSLILFTAALIWGFTFVAQSVGMDYVGPFTFIAMRNIVALMVLLPMAAIMDRHGKKQPRQTDRKEQPAAPFRRRLLRHLPVFGKHFAAVRREGYHCGQSGLHQRAVYGAGAAAGDFPGEKDWTAHLGRRRAGGFWHVSALHDKGDFHLQKGDLYLFACAIVFSLQILSVDHFSPMMDGVKLSCMQTLTNAVLGAICMLLFERPDFGSILAAWMPIVYAGALSSGIGYTFQIIGQKNLNPAIASLIMSLESVISALAGWLLLDQILSPRELAGCALTFLAIILVQLPGQSQKRIAENKGTAPDSFQWVETFSIHARIPLPEIPCCQPFSFLPYIFTRRSNRTQ